MILSNVDIRKVLEDGRLIIDPMPAKERIDTTSIDLRLGEPLWIWDPELVGGKGGELRINADQLNFKELSERYLMQVPRESSGQYIIRPQRVYLASTFEKVKLPTGSCLSARVEGKSSFARLGLAVHMTAPTIHCGTGFGIITLEIYNHGPFSIKITPGTTRICQLIIEQVLSEPEERSERTFSAQKNPKG